MHQGRGLAEGPFAHQPWVSSSAVPGRGLPRGHARTAHLRQIGPAPQVQLPKSRRNRGKFQTAV
jgi:hypothetical protein